jgi:DNA-binding response OmpR family regulator/GGDEF domain-containing protein
VIDGAGPGALTARELPGYLEALEVALRDERDPVRRGAVLIRLADLVIGIGRSIDQETIVAAAERVTKLRPPLIDEAGRELAAAIRAHCTSQAVKTRRWVLIASGDQRIKTVLNFALTQSDREIMEAAGRSEILQALSRYPVELVVLDPFLPDADPRQLILEIKQQSLARAVSVLVVAPDDTVARAEWRRLGASGFVDASLLATVATAELDQVEGDDVVIVERDDPDRLARAALGERLDQLAKGAAQESAVALVEARVLAGNGVAGGSIPPSARRTVTRLLHDALPPAVLVAHWRDDEFLVLWPETPLPAATSDLKKSLDALAASPLEIEAGKQARVGASAGIVSNRGYPDRSVVGAAYLRLLKAQAAGPGVVVGDEQAPANRNQRLILLGEDDLLTARILIHRLTKEGFEVVHRSSGTELIEVAETIAPALAIFEIKLPGMDGFELLSKLRRLPAYTDVPVMLLAAIQSEEQTLRALESGADDCLGKPFSPRELIARVQGALRRRGKRA